MKAAYLAIGLLCVLPACGSRGDGDPCIGDGCDDDPGPGGPGGCVTNDDCQSDSFCDPATSTCEPYGPAATDDSCTQVAAIGVFAPAVQCDWPGPPLGDAHPGHINVLTTPAVTDFDFDGDPATVTPSIVFVSYNGYDGDEDACIGNDSFFGVIRVIDGQSCAQQHSLATPAVVASGPVAVADLDKAADGRPEIVAHRIGGGMVAFRFDPDTQQFVELWATASTLGAATCNWAGPSIHDLDDDGRPEVIMGASVFDGQTGALIDGSRGLAFASRGQIPVVADVDGDDRPDLLTGDAVLEWDPAARAWATVGSGLGTRGLVAVADFGTYGATAGADDRAALDGVPEIAVVGAGKARIQTVSGRVVFGPVPLRFFAPAVEPGTGGPPTIADFDGDGRAEIAVAGRGGYNVFDPDCTGTPDAAFCATLGADGILWAMPTQDLSSSVTGSSVFDFEGDGAAEVVYGDECFSRVYGGASGEIEFSQFRSSCTWYENPIVADVDGDFNSEIVIPSNENCADIVCPAIDPQFDGLRCIEDADCPGTTRCGYEADGDATGRCRCAASDDCGGNGYVCADPIAGPSAAGQVCRAGHPGTKQHGVRVVRDAIDRWVNSRPIWNQHAYAVTHVEDDSAVPASSAWAPNWTTPGYNNFRQAIAADPESHSTPDLTSRAGETTCVDQGTVLAVDVCNRGTEPVGAAVPVTFYDGDPAAGNALCTAATDRILLPGDCAAATCVASGLSSRELDVTAVADDDGTGRGANTECHEGNNRTQLRVTGCAVVE